MTPLDFITMARIAGKFIWMHKAWAIIAVLGFMLLFAKMDARHWRKQAAQNDAAYKLEVSKNSINLVSIAQLQTALGEKNAESDARAAAFAASRAQDAADVAAADQRLRATTSRIAVLRGIAAHAQANPTCKAPDALLAGAEGL